MRVTHGRVAAAAPAFQLLLGLQQLPALRLHSSAQYFSFVLSHSSEAFATIQAGEYFSGCDEWQGKEQDPDTVFHSLKSHLYLETNRALCLIYAASGPFAFC